MTMIVRIILIVGVVIVMGVVSMLVINRAQQSQQELPYYGKLPQFSFTDQDGLTFTQTDMENHVFVVDFIFTRCHGPCPVMAVNMGTLYTQFAPEPRVKFLSISVEPDYDSTKVLKAYANEQGVTDSRWKFIRNDIDKVVSLCEQGFKLPAEDLPGMHTTKFVLVDQKGYIRAYYDGTDAAAMSILASDISILLERGE